MSTYDFNLITAFANSAPNNEIEAFPDYDRGLGIAFVETDGKPEMKGLNGLFSLLTVSLLALKQRGILTWTTGFEYKQGAFAVESNRLYQAKTDNTCKQPSLSQNDWQVWASVSDIDVDTNGNIIKTAKAGGAFTLKVEDATTTVKGVARFATATEVINKSNVSAAVTPSGAATIAQSTGFGVGQTIKHINRSTGVEYTNDTSKTITIFFAVAVGTYGTSTAYCNTGSGDVSVGSVFGDVGSGGSVRGQLVIIAPPQARYKVIGGSIVSSSELS